MDTIKNLKDDEIQAWKELCSVLTLHPMNMDEGTVHLHQEDVEHSEEQPDPHFKYNDGHNF